MVSLGLSANRRYSTVDNRIQAFLRKFFGKILALHNGLDIGYVRKRGVQKDDELLRRNGRTIE